MILPILPACTAAATGGSCGGSGGPLSSRPDARGHLHPAFDLSGRDTQPPGQAVHHRRHHHGLIGRIGDLNEYPIHQPAVAALLSLEVFGHFHAELVAHLITGEAADFAVSGLHLIGQRAKQLTRRLPVTNPPTPQRYPPPPPNKPAQVRPSQNLWMKSELWITRPLDTDLSVPVATGLRRTRNGRGK